MDSKFIMNENDLDVNENKKYSEKQLRKAIKLYAKWLTGGMPSLKIAKTSEERISQILQILETEQNN